MEPIDPYRRWQIADCPFAIECSYATLDEIRTEVENSSGDGREAGGVLFGRNEPGRIRIVAHRPLDCEHAMGPGFVLSANDEKEIARLIASDLGGLEPLGWYHSHIYSKIFLSERDLQIHSEYFPAPFQVALVLQPRSERPARAAFFFRAPGGAMRTESSYEEFTIERAPAVKVQPDTAMHRPGNPRGRKIRQPELPVCPKCGSKRVQKSHRRHILKRIWNLFGYYPYRCQECLSRFYLRISPDLLGTIRRKRIRPEERQRVWMRTRREILLYGVGIFGFLLFLLFLMRETAPKGDQP